MTSRQVKMIALCAAFVAIRGFAQTTVTTNGGTTNSVPIFTGSSAVGNSVITQSNGNVGIGTTNPQSVLNTYDSGVSKDTTVEFSGGVEIQSATGNRSLTVGPQLEFIAPTKTDGTNAWGLGRIITVAGDTTNAYADGEMILGTRRYFNKLGTGSGWYYGDDLSINSNGYVGIGTTTPGAKLDVAGNIKLSGSGASITFPDGTVQSTAWSGTLCGGDYAESVDITGERTQYEPGDVLVVDPDHPGHFLKASERYSTLVAGIYSTKPGMIGRRQTIDPKLASTEIPMAMVGVVPTKVSTENGSIHPGDILVTSSTSGRAMKGTDRSLFAGAIVGKALGPLDSGSGVIEVLVSLQ
jgi:hypothetical protein